MHPCRLQACYRALITPSLPASVLSCSRTHVVCSAALVGTGSCVGRLTVRVVRRVYLVSCPSDVACVTLAVARVVPQEERYFREEVYLSLMHKCMQLAKRERHMDLFKYFENLYESEKDSDHMFMGTRWAGHRTCHSNRM